MFEDQISKFENEMVQIGVEPQTTFAKSVLSALELENLTIPAREPVVGTWWMQGALGFIFGQRGLGKTWMAAHLARCIAEGSDCGPWKIEKGRNVLYVDGEMALDALRERDRALRESDDAPLFYLSHEKHFERTGQGMNLSSVEAQHALSQLCRDVGIEVMFLDNLSCLFSGVRENDADDWEAILPWLLDLRREGIAVCIVHHSGRNTSNMRGTSRREDAAFWVMRLDAPGDDDFPGAHFISRFTKFREGEATEQGPWQWMFESYKGKTFVHHKLIESMDMFVQCVREGVESCTEIAELMNVRKGTVSKWAKRAADANLIRNDSGRYRYIGP